MVGRGSGQRDTSAKLAPQKTRRSPRFDGSGPALSGLGQPRPGFGLVGLEGPQTRVQLDLDARPRGPAGPETLALNASARAQVNDALGFAHAAFDPAFGQQFHLDGGAHKHLDVVLKLLCRLLSRRTVRGYARAGLDLHRQMIQRPLARQHALVVRGQIALAQDVFLDLGGEHVDAAHDHHVVAAAGDFFHAAHGACGARAQYVDHQRHGR